jgi:uncharacterized membrane protein YagU involved in acid resistance
VRWIFGVTDLETNDPSQAIAELLTWEEWSSEIIGHAAWTWVSS